MASQPIVHLTWPQLIGVVITSGLVLFGAAWGAGALIFGDVKTDVREIRDNLRTLTQEDTTIRGLLSGSEKELRREITHIGEVVVENRTALEFLVADVGEIKNGLKIK